MIRRIYNALSIAGGIFFLALLALAIPSFMSPAFEVANDSQETISVVARWRNGERRVDAIASGKSHEFSIDDEAAMTFIAHFADGRELQSEPIYFTRGVKVTARVSGNSIAVGYATE